MVVFTDLCVKWKEDKPIDDKIMRLIKLGYRQVAVNNIVLPQSTGKTKGKGDNQKKQLKDPYAILLPEHKLRIHNSVQLTDTGSKLKQLSRLTLIFSKAEQVHNLHSADIQAYDILAVQPTNKDLFHLSSHCWGLCGEMKEVVFTCARLQMACQTLEVDIISLDLSEPLSFNLKYPSLHTAIERGIHFEIQYGPLIRDQEARKNIIMNVQSLIEVGKGKNLILSSGCDNTLDLRGPYDVRVLGLMLGISEVKARAAITSNCQSVLSHAAARKAGRSMVSMMKLDDIEEKDTWIAKATDTDRLDRGSSDEDTSSSDDDGDDDDGNDDDDGGNRKRAPKEDVNVSSPPKQKKRKT